MARPLLREPLLHFLIAGAFLFAGYLYLNPTSEVAPDEIVVTAVDIETMAQAFEASWRRAPTEDEQQALVESFIREEVLVREAEALGLDRDDAIIRQRLRQKMDFLLSSGANALTPTDEDLTTFLTENADRFEVRGQIAFDQVYLGQSVVLEDVDAAKAALQSGADANTIGQQTLLPATLPLSHPISIDSTFGAGFAGNLLNLPMGDWAGPVISGYGVHVVRVTERTDPTLPPLGEIRDKVEAGWRDQRAGELAEALFEELRSRYTIQIEGDA
ncbi:MAG: peptidyl-prolyl cis-trans isomerase [Paracoccaceae bacterium]